MKALLWLVLGSIGCVSTGTVPCSEETVCRGGTSCVAVGGDEICATPDQLEQCREKPDGELCMHGGLVASCFTEVCLPPECGNGRVEPGEACDDANDDAGDGCSFECQSDERCGNAIVDAVTRSGQELVPNEQCDDGNVVAHDGCSNQCRVETAQWTALTQGTPVARTEAAMAYDAARGRTIMFGGRTSGQVDLDEQWEWDGAIWTLTSLLTAPSPRSNHAMVYASRSHEIVLFGGAADQGVLDDTWIWNGTLWRFASSTMRPSARVGHRIAYDAGRDRVVLFGGRDTVTASSSDAFRDTWEWDGQTWTRVCEACGPAARGDHAMTYDPIRGVVVMYGGVDRSTKRSDVWEYDGTWRNVTPTSGTGPGMRTGASFSFDAARGLSVLVGGTNASNQADAWGWNGQQWTTLPMLPSSTSRHATAADTTRGKIVVFGPTLSTHELDGSMWRSTPGTMSPQPAVAAAAATDLERRETVRFGGVGAVSEETWVFDGRAWMQMPIGGGPPGRTHHALAFDPIRRNIVMFGGQDDGATTVGDTWTWNGATRIWTAKASASPRHGHALSWDGIRVVGFGGANGSTLLDSTVAWDGASWSTLSPTAHPSARTGHRLAFDPIRGRVILFGGRTATGLSGETWEWDGAAWASIATTESPQPREDAALAWDPSRRRIVLFGGRTDAAVLDDVWEYDGATWRSTVHVVRPMRRSGHLLFATAHGLVASSGDSGLVPGTEPLADSWRLRWENFVPDEVCHSGLDLDQDTMSGCDDADCWAVCQPLCPPGMPATCVASGQRCGDSMCSATESCWTCPADCGECAARCGDFACTSGETAASCPGDC